MLVTVPDTAPLGHRFELHGRGDCSDQQGGGFEGASSTLQCLRSKLGGLQLMLSSQYLQADDPV